MTDRDIETMRIRLKDTALSLCSLAHDLLEIAGKLKAEQDKPQIILSIDGVSCAGGEQ